MSNAHELKKGDSVILNLPGSILDGAKALCVRQSQRTGSCTVKLLEDRGCYAKGDHVIVKRWELS